MMQFKSAKTGMHWITKKWTAHLVPGQIAVGMESKLLVYRTESQLPDLPEATDEQKKDLIRVVFRVKIMDLRGKP